MTCFSDTDIILKLCAIDLLDETLETFGVTSQEVFVLKHEVINAASDPERSVSYPVEALNAAVMFAHAAQPIREAPDPEEQAYLTNAPKIDPGEAVLFGATRNKRDFILMTGDKRALRSLQTANGCGGICSRLAGRVYCLEQVLLRLIARLGYDEVSEAVQQFIANFAETDRSFREAFQVGMTQDETTRRLELLVSELRATTGELLAP